MAEITAQAVNEFRKKTGLGLMECKKLLQEAGGDFHKAETLAKERGLKPVGRIVAWSTAGVDPSIMGIGPVPSSEKALKAAGLTLEKIDRIEVNEAFAAQYLAVEKALKLDRDKTNVNGGAIALGHPLAASGTRLVITLLNELRRNGLRYGLATACIGGGQGIAMIVENIAKA